LLSSFIHRSFSSFLYTDESPTVTTRGLRSSVGAQQSFPDLILTQKQIKTEKKNKMNTNDQNI